VTKQREKTGEKKIEWREIPG